jgi:hypothetical protein
MRTLVQLVPGLAIAAALALSTPSVVETRDPGSAAMEEFLSRSQVAHQYRALRHLEASGGGQRGWLDARTHFAPDTGMQYEVTAEGGSGYIRSRVLRPLLQQEQELIAAGRTGSVALDVSNYQFSLAGETADGLVRVAMRPLRRDRALIAGELVLAAHTGELLRVNGRLAKNPSFWTKRVDVARVYASINGVVMPVTLDSAAELRLFGRSSLRMAYDYTEVDHRPVWPGADQE